MIDYDKLKLVYELCEKTSIEISYAYKNKDSEFVAWVTLDQLLLELEELSQPEPKYKTGWYVLDGRIKSTEVLNQTGYVCCDKTAVEAVGRTMYTSREELIQAQIEYWKKLKQEHCEHESDGSIFRDYPPTSKCKKCGEFYR